jgi:hypothetical protein
MTSSRKDPIALLDEADGNPQWLKEALEAIWQRLPPVPPPAPPATAQLPSWDPAHLALFQIDPGAVPLTSNNRWYLAAWLKRLAGELTDGTFNEGDSKDGFRTIFLLGKDGGR